MSPDVSLDYREHDPCDALRGDVACVWTLRSTPRLHRVVPDGCMDMVFDLRSGRGWIGGVMTRALVSTWRPPLAIVGVRFHPGTASRFFPFTAREMVDAIRPIDEVWGAEGVALAATLPELAPSRRIAHVQRALLARRRPVAVDRRVARAVAILRARGGNAPVAEIAGDVGLGARHLERLFGDAIGVAPKPYARVLRLHGVTERLRGVASPSWTRLALECGYADQSHLIRDFRTILGVSPSEYVRDRFASGERDDEVVRGDPPIAVIQ